MGICKAPATFLRTVLIHDGYLVGRTGRGCGFLKLRAAYLPRFEDREAGIARGRVAIPPAAGRGAGTGWVPKKPPVAGPNAG
jgi:hypothetical protein